MAASEYHVRVDRSAGTIEISGPDKEWIAEQLEALVPIIGTAAAPSSGSTPRSSDEQGLEVPGETTSKTTTRKSNTRKAGSSTTYQSVPELAAKLAGVKSELSAYRASRSKAKAAQQEVVVLAGFLKENLGLEEVSANDLYTVYNEMGWKAPALASSLNNAKVRKGFFTSSTNGKYRLSHNGENFAKHDSKD